MRSYSSIYNLGHRAAQDILRGPVVVQEKVDGSQFSFMVHVTGNPEGPDYGEELVMKSKGARVMPETADKLFKPAVETVMRLPYAPSFNTVTYVREQRMVPLRDAGRV